MLPNDSLLAQELRRDEGVRYILYKDTRGFNTTGVGHNVDAHPLPDDWAFPLNDAQVDELLAGDLQSVFDDLDTHCPWWREMSYVRQRALANFVFNVGITVALTFKTTLRLLETLQYDAAATAILESKWSSQVGARAVRIADMIRAG